MQNVWVPIDYEPDTFLGIPVHSHSKSLESLRSQNNQCYRVLVQSENPDDAIIEKRENATDWERRSNNCTEFFCNNETGPVSRITCHDSNEYKVEIDLDSIYILDWSSEQVIEMLRTMELRLTTTDRLFTLSCLLTMKQAHKSFIVSLMNAQV